MLMECKRLNTEFKRVCQPGQHRQYSDQATGCMPKKSQFESWQGQEVFLSFILSRPALKPTHPSIRCVQGLLPKQLIPKGKMSICLHLEPRLPLALDRSKWSASHCSCSTPRQCSWYLLNRNLDGPQRWSRCFGEEMNYRQVLLCAVSF